MRNNRGFTLVEILIGITLSVLLFSIVFAALRLAHRSEEKGRERQELSQRMRVVSDRLSWIVRGAYPYAYQKEEKEVIVFEGASDSATFVTTSTDPYSAGIEDVPGMKLVKIFIDDEGLKVAERLFWLKEGWKEYVLEPGATGIRFEYMKVEREKQEASWESSWNAEEKEAMPAAVRISLSLNHKGRKVALPEIIAPVRAARVGEEQVIE